MPFRTGEPYSAKGGALPAGTYYAWCGNRHELTVVQDSPKPEARAAVAAGEVELALVHEPPVVIFLARIPGLGGWQEAPFCWHLLPRSERRLPRALREGESAILDLALVRGENGIVDAAGWMTLDPTFSWVLHRAVCEEARRAWDPVVFHHAFESLRARYPRPELLLDIATPCRRARLEGREPPALDEVLRAEAVPGPGEDSVEQASERPPPGEAEPDDPDSDDTAVSRLPDPGDGC